MDFIASRASAQLADRQDEGFRVFLSIEISTLPSLSEAMRFLKQGAKTMQGTFQKTEGDAFVENHGSIFLVRPVSAFAVEWLRENVAEESTWFGNALAVEHRYVGDLAEGMKSDGFVLR